MRTPLSHLFRTSLVTGSLLLFAGSLLAKPPAASGPVFYLPTGPTTLKAKDASGNKNVIKAVSLVVSNSPSLVSMQDTHQLTLALWIKPNSIPNEFPVLISKGGNEDPNDFGGYELILNTHGNDDIIFDSGDYMATTSGSGGTLVNQHLGEWIHVAFTIDTTAQTAQFYVNGQSVTNFTSMGNISDVNFNLPNDLRIGCPDPAANVNRASFDGDINQVLIYNRALSADEIQKVFSTTAPKTKHGGS